MKLVRLETIRLNDGSYKLRFNEKGITPHFPNTINESGDDIASGKVGEEAIYYHHLDRDETRYLIYIKGYLGQLDGNEISDLEKSLDAFLIEQKT
ncbi:hypothetical protein [Acinetobacter nosocomialis]|uniref:hypothetical protein n=1 Tax=Acinetobacter nosocomialis TaxID=106654 RepID=UPI0009E12CB1|nr:hypothetical protein [Acinetobacter nosocomialis]ARG16351.1 hypothetical protein B7L44_06930 [Acinetobacter nosocomialis]RSN88693.1 hypothetical protein EA768_00830 [Acinetobacter nosocomialis]